MRLPHRLQGQKVKSQGHGAGAYCGGHLAAQLVLHAKKRLLAELVLLGLYSLYMWPRVTVHEHNLKMSSHVKSTTPNTIFAARCDA